MNLEGAASFIAMFGLVELFISQTDTSYIIQCNRPQYAHIPLGLSRDTIILQDKINVYEVPRNSSPLDTLFAHINDSVFFYDYKYEPNTVSAHIPFYARFALLDSIGNIKILANVETLSSTQEYYNKNKNKQLLLNPQLFNFLSRFLYIE